jgi:hypothetical protein
VTGVFRERFFDLMDDRACPAVANDLAVPIASTIDDAFQAEPTTALPVKVIADLSFGERATASGVASFERQRASCRHRAADPDFGASSSSRPQSPRRIRWQSTDIIVLVDV